jgi:predicted ATPase
MISNVKLQNFKSHRSTKLCFDDSRLHGLVGRNGCGKTSILQALQYQSQLTDEGLSSEKIFKNQNAPEFITTRNCDGFWVRTNGSWGQNRSQQWEASYGFHHYGFEDYWQSSGLSLVFDGQKIEDFKSAEDWDDEIEPMTWQESQALGGAYYPVDLTIYQQVLSTVYVKLVTTNLAKASHSEDLKPKVEFNGLGLASNLDYLRDEYPDSLQMLQDMLKRIVPNVRKVGVKRAKVIVNRQRLIEVNGKTIPYEESQEVIGKEVVLDMDTGERIPAHAISEGTMLTLGLLTILMNPQRPSLILLDDIEQGLHPKAQRELIAVFKEIIQENSDLQIIFTTHSPYIIDELQPSQVHVLSNAGDGFTKTKRLDEHPDVTWAKQTLTTGEFWDAEGEDWVIDGATND